MALLKYVASKEKGYSIIGDKKYRVVTMPDGKVWMAENLDFITDGIIIGSYAWYYNNDEATYGWTGKKYGLLYDWYAAKSIEIDGWHLPTKDEWDQLANAVGGASIAGTKLKATSDWYSGNGTDDYGFSVLPTGFRSGSSFSNMGSNDYFWTATEYSSTNAYYSYFSTNASMGSGNGRKTNFAFSVRLVKDQ